MPFSSPIHLLITTKKKWTAKKVSLGIFYSVPEKKGWRVQVPSYKYIVKFYYCRNVCILLRRWANWMWKCSEGWNAGMEKIISFFFPSLSFTFQKVFLTFRSTRHHLRGHFHSVLTLFNHTSSRIYAQHSLARPTCTPHIRIHTHPHLVCTKRIM